MSRPPARALALFWLLNAILYPLLMPLWDGFDEPFHYGYSQHLATRGTWPVLGQTPLSRELLRSLELAPASHVVRHNLPFVTTFSEFHAMPAAERQARRAAVDAIDSRLRFELAPGTSNYEAQQPPLAYLLPAAVEWLAGERPLAERALLARLAVSLAGGGLQLWLAWLLAAELGIASHWRPLALFLLAGSQMFYATVSRVSNDWLAVPLATLIFVAALRFQRNPGARQAGLLGLALAAGLLTKAYFLPWAACAVALVAWRRDWRAVAAALAAIALAAPWYIRNIALYGAFSGMQQSATGVTLGDTWQAALNIPWPKVLLAAARDAVWTGNNSFTSFSTSTIDLFLLLGLAALVCWARSGRRPAEWLTVGGVAAYVCALVYVNALCVADGTTPDYVSAPWYAQPLGAPCACLAVSGLSRAGRFGRWVAAALAALSTYLICATYFLKLLPLYAGFSAPRVKPAAILNWYFTDPGQWFAVLRDTAPGPPAIIVVLACAVALAAAYAMVQSLAPIQTSPCDNLEKNLSASDAGSRQ